MPTTSSTPLVRVQLQSARGPKQTTKHVTEDHEFGLLGTLPIRRKRARPAAPDPVPAAPEPPQQSPVANTPPQLVRSPAIVQTTKSQIAAPNPANHRSPQQRQLEEAAPVLLTHTGLDIAALADQISSSLGVRAEHEELNPETRLTHLCAAACSLVAQSLSGPNNAGAAAALRAVSDHCKDAVSASVSSGSVKLCAPSTMHTPLAQLRAQARERRGEHSRSLMAYKERLQEQERELQAMEQELTELHARRQQCSRKTADDLGPQERVPSENKQVDNALIMATVHGEALASMMENVEELCKQAAQQVLEEQEMYMTKMRRKAPDMDSPARSIQQLARAMAPCRVTQS